MSIYVTIYTKEKGKLELTYDQWFNTSLGNLIFHREDGPAVEYSDGTKYWFINGKLHREDGPAIEQYNGTNEWYINGKLHRQYNGDKWWYINGKRHREDGPAIEYNEYKLCWFINDEEYYSKADYNRLLEEVDSLEPILGLIDPRDWVRKRFERKYKYKI